MKNQYRITKDLVKKWLFESRFSGANLVTFILYAFCAVAFASSTVMYMFFVNGKWYNIYISVLMCALCVFKAYPEKYINLMANYKRVAKLNGSDSWMMTVELGEDAVIITEGATTTTYPHPCVKKLVEKKDKYILRFDNKISLRIYKNAFVDCTEQEFVAFLKEKMIRAN